MAIQSGTHLGPYEILSAIAAGGMGEVYRARDTRLDRIVAIKVLPMHLADRSELRERFEREARTIASLNHPHICTLHDVGHQDGTDYLVMEYLEGDTLAQRLIKGPLPLEQVLQYAVEIADALDKAHRKGVTHRDLKPGNIVLTKSGTKLLDFGLAKLQQEVAPTNIQVSQGPTMSQPLTAQGTIVGTLQYMAPEQLEGKEVDARTDIFAFGTVVYEMATGKKAFEGKSQASVIAKILETDPPPISSLQPMTPPALDRLVRKCLAKEPERRWQTASDVCDELKWIAEGGSQAQVPASAAARSVRASWRQVMLWSSIGLLVGAVGAGFVVWILKPVPTSPTRPVTRTVINLPPGDQLAALDYPAIAISPDGTQLAYVAIHSGMRQIYLRALNSLEAKPLIGTEGANSPFFSPDGEWLGFFADGKLKKISVNGGAALVLADAPRPYGANWGRQGTIVFTPIAGPLEQVSDAGGAVQPLTRVAIEKGEVVHQYPEFLSDSQAVLFATGPDIHSQPITVQSLRSGERRNLVPGGTSPHYASSGHLLYVQGGNLMAAPFDPQHLQLTGAPVPVVVGVLELTGNGVTQYSISAMGSLVYIPGGARAVVSKLVWVSRNGTEQPLAAPPHMYVEPRLSPGGRQLAITIQEPESQIWLYEIGRDTLTRLTFSGSLNTAATWTPDGRRIAFVSNAEGPSGVFWESADRSGGLERLTTDVAVPDSFSPDGQLLAYNESNPNTSGDIFVLRLTDRKATRFLQTPFNEVAARFSPDGHLLTYVSDESGSNEVYVQPYPGPGGKWQISTDGGTEPVWNRNGRELFYRSGGKMMAVDIATQPSFSAGKPKMLFQGQYVLTGSGTMLPNYDVSPDGQRLLMLKASEQAEAAPTQIIVVQNWFEELKQKVPPGPKE